jgi:hypothetical protein
MKTENYVVMGDIYNYTVFNGTIFDAKIFASSIYDGDCSISKAETYVDTGTIVPTEYLSIKSNGKWINVV